MRLSLLELGFWYSTSLRALGLPYGAVPAAVKMVQWADALHGLGARFLERRREEPLSVDPGAIRLTSDEGAVCRIGGGGQTSLLLGPAALDLACAKASGAGRGLAAVEKLRDLAWLGALAERAARRGFLCAVTFSAPADSREAGDLAALYSPARSIIALPADGHPLWIEAPFASSAHAALLAGELPGEPAELLRALLSPGEAGKPGFAVACYAPEAGALGELAAQARELAAATGARVWEPGAVAEAWRRLICDGLEVEDALYYSLANFGLTTVIRGSESSRRQAGADS